MSEATLPSVPSEMASLFGTSIFAGGLLAYLIFLLVFLALGNYFAAKAKLAQWITTIFVGFGWTITAIALTWLPTSTMIFIIFLIVVLAARDIRDQVGGGVGDG